MRDNNDTIRATNYICFDVNICVEKKSLNLSIQIDNATEVICVHDIVSPFDKHR